jgi:osmotically inducible lipoprotein OsmB
MCEGAGMNKTALTKTAACLVAVAFLTACATQNQTGGTVGGAVIGGLLGHAIGGKRGAVIGAAFGAAIGNEVGKRLDESDRVKLAEAQRNALAQQRQQTFYAPSARSNVVVTPGATYYEPSPRQLALASDINRLELIESGSETTTALLDMPIYRNANFLAPPKMTVPRGARITRLAFVKADPKWVLVGERSFGLGYVPAMYLDREIAEKLATATNVARAASPVTPRQRTAKDLVPSKTEQLLSSDANYLPPPDHTRRSAVSQEEFKRAVDDGNRNAQTKTAVSFVAPAVECKDLTAVLLTNEKETGREVNKVCRAPGQGWSL